MKTLAITLGVAFGLALAVPAVSQACPGKDKQVQASKDGKKKGKTSVGKNRAAPQPPKS